MLKKLAHLSEERSSTGSLAPLIWILVMSIVITILSIVHADHHYDHCLLASIDISITLVASAKAVDFA